MKKVVSAMALIGAGFFALQSTAAVLTVSNNSNSPGQYTDLQAACDAAEVGDTLYIHASQTSYGDASIRKRLVLIGEGALPDEQIEYGTTVGALHLTYSPEPSTDNATGTHIYGLNITGGAYSVSLDRIAPSAGAACVSYVHISRCRFTSLVIQGGLTYYPWDNYYSSHNLITQCVIGGVSGLFYYSVFSNNIIGLISTKSNPDPSPGNNTFSNNLITGIQHSLGNLYTNNIFYSPTGDIINGSPQFSSTTFTNNLFIDSGSTVYSDIIYGSNTGTGNIFQQDPMFVTGVDYNTLSQYSYTYPASGPFADYHLQASSPGKNYGTDGMDIGIYGGGYPWVDGSEEDSRFRYFPMPSQVPYVISMDILNTTIPANGTLNINFNARVQD